MRSVRRNMKDIRISPDSTSHELEKIAEVVRLPVVVAKRGSLIWQRRWAYCLGSW